MSAIEIPLKHTINSPTGKKITTLTLRRPTRKDLKLAQKNSKDEVEMEDLLFSSLTGLPVEDLDLLDIEDNAKLTDSFRRMQRGDGASSAAAGRNSAGDSEDPAV